jgi:hypothetical protein
MMWSRWSSANLYFLSSGCGVLGCHDECVVGYRASRQGGGGRQRGTCASSRGRARLRPGRPPHDLLQGDLLRALPRGDGLDLEHAQHQASDVLVKVTGRFEVSGAGVEAVQTCRRARPLPGLRRSARLGERKRHCPPSFQSTASSQTLNRSMPQSPQQRRAKRCRRLALKAMSQIDLKSRDILTSSQNVT